jgi:hypothetical protein
MVFLASVSMLPKRKPRTKAISIMEDFLTFCIIGPEIVLKNVIYSLGEEIHLRYLHCGARVPLLLPVRHQQTVVGGPARQVSNRQKRKLPCFRSMKHLESLLSFNQTMKLSASLYALHSSRGSPLLVILKSIKCQKID